MTLSEWTSLKDKLPPLGEMVLVLDINRNDDYSIFVARIDERGWFHGPRDFDICVNSEDLTHWMSLPEKQKCK